MLYYFLFLSALLFSSTSTFAHLDGLDVRTENSTFVTITDNDTFIELTNAAESENMDFWVANDEKKFNFYLDLNCAVPNNYTSSVEAVFTIGGGKDMRLTFSEISTENATLNGSNVKLDDGKLKLAVYLRKQELRLNDDCQQSYDLGEISTVKYHHQQHRVNFKVSRGPTRGGHCQEIYQFPKSDVFPLTSTVTDDDAVHESTTTTLAKNSTETPEKWYNREAFQKIGIAYLWILTCCLCFVIGMCTGQRQNKDTVQTIEVNNV